MTYPRSRRALFLLLATGACLRAFAQGEPTLVFGARVFSIRGDAESEDALKASRIIPALLFARIRDSGGRFPSESERLRIFERKRDAAVSAAIAAVQASISIADRLRLVNPAFAFLTPEYVKAKKDRKAAELKLAEARKLSPTPSDKPFLLKPAPGANGDGGMLLPVAADDLLCCEANNVDLLVTGEVRAAGGFLAYRVELFSRALGSVVHSAGGTAAFDDIERVTEEIVPEFEEAVIGRPFARLSFNAAPLGVSIKVDGVDAPAHPLYYYSDRTVEVVASAPGYATRDSFAEIKVGERTVLDIALEPLAMTTLELATFPPGADTFVDGTWMGKTPLSLPFPSASNVVRFELPGFEPSVVGLHPGSGRTLPVFPLSKEGDKASRRVAKAKDSFYGSLGYFVLSLPVSVLSYGIFQTYMQSLVAVLASDPLGTDSATALAASRLESAFYASQTVFWTSAALSVILGGNAAVRLGAYVGAAE